MRDMPQDVQSYLVAQGLVVDGQASDDNDWSSTRGGGFDEIDRLVTITEDGGPTPQVPASSGLGSGALGFPGVQVRVRGRANERDTARTKAAAIYDALHGLSGATLGSAAYMLVHARTSEFALFYDERSRPNYTMSYQATVAQVA